jgi:hypothetical protein
MFSQRSYSARRMRSCPLGSLMHLGPVPLVPFLPCAPGERLAEPGQLQLSPFRSFGFDSAAIVLLSATDCAVSRASKVPRHVVESSAVYRQHVNGKVLFARPEIMGHAEATDLTATLRAAQTGRAPDKRMHEEIDAEPALWTPLRILQGVRGAAPAGSPRAELLDKLFGVAEDEAFLTPV